MNRTLKKGRRLLQIALAALFLLSAMTIRAQQTKQPLPASGTTPGSGATPGSATTTPGAGSAAQQTGSGPQIHELSLDQAVDYATKNSVLVKNALLDYQIQEQSNRATTSQALPPDQRQPRPDRLYSDPDHSYPGRIRPAARDIHSAEIRYPV